MKQMQQQFTPKPGQRVPTPQRGVLPPPVRRSP